MDIAFFEDHRNPFNEFQREVAKKLVSDDWGSFFAQLDFAEVMEKALSPRERLIINLLLESHTLLKQLKDDLVDSYDVIMFDFRGHGKNSGLFTWTSKENLDLETALDYAKGKYEKIGLIGFSLGGAVSIAVCAANDSVNSLVVVAAPSEFEKIDYRFWELDPDTDIAYNLGKEGSTGKGVRTGLFWLNKPRPLALVEKIACPVLYIHGDKDWVVDYKHSQKLYEHTNSRKEIKIFKGGPHTEYLLKSNPQKFTGLIKEWFKKTIK